MNVIPSLLSINNPRRVDVPLKSINHIKTYIETLFHGICQSPKVINLCLGHGTGLVEY